MGKHERHDHVLENYGCWPSSNNADQTKNVNIRMLMIRPKYSKYLHKSTVMDVNTQFRLLHALDSRQS